MQVVRTGPHVGEDQRPEVNHGQTVGVNRTSGSLRHEVVHHAQEACGQEEAHGVVSVPPLDHRILNTGIHGVGLGQRDRHCHAVDDVQQGDGDDEGAEEPVGHVDMGNLADRDRAEENEGVGNPDQRDQNVDRPFEFGVFLTLGDTQRQRDRRQQNDDLPTPESEGNQRTAPKTHVTGALDSPVGRCEQGAAAKREDDRVGVQRTQSAKVQEADIQLRPDQLGCNDDTDQHANNAPDDGHDGELPDDLVVICGLRSRHEPTSR